MMAIQKSKNLRGPIDDPMWACGQRAYNWVYQKHQDLLVSLQEEEEDEWTLAYEIKFDFRLGGYGAPQVTIVCILDNDSWTVGFLKQLVLIVSTPST